MGDATGISTSASRPSPNPTTVSQQSASTPSTSTLANGSPNPTAVLDPTTQSQTKQLTALQQHVLFWDRDNDGIIYPMDVYNGFRALGFSVIFSIGSFLIPFFFSYATTIAHSYIPDPRYRIYVSSIHKAKHGSDTGIYDVDGHFEAARFDAMFARYDTTNSGGLSAGELWTLWKKNRCAADPAGWSFAFMEMWTTWLLLQEDGRVWKDDLKACYDGTLFWRISEMNESGEGWRKGYGMQDFVEGIWYGRTWKNWELEDKKKTR
jgi:peroxygenase